MSESFVPHGDGMLVKAGKEVVKQAKHIVYTPYKGQGVVPYLGDAVAATVWKGGVEVPLTLAGKAVSGIIKGTLNRAEKLLGGAVKLTGKALLASPLFPVPSPKA